MYSGHGFISFENNLVPRVLCYPSLAERERPVGTGGREPWGRGCSFNSNKSIGKSNKPQSYTIYLLNDECLVFLFDTDRRNVDFIFEGGREVLYKKLVKLNRLDIP